MDDDGDDDDNISRYGATGAVYQQTFQLRTPLFWDLMNQIMKTR
jgi:hypothetical protein